MKIVILGGTGVFGSRLARLLARDGHDLTLAARGGSAALSAELGAKSLVCDRNRDPAALFAEHPDLVVDAAGPFQFYKSDPYRLARAAIAAGVNYMDLSDDADFTAGISVLDGDAKAAGCYVLSGVSSVPALSGAVVTHLAAGLDSVDAIDGAILPGNRAPRGRSVMAAILAQVGQPMPVYRGGVWQSARGWSDRRDYALPGGEIRRGWLNRVPDLALFPTQFKARTVTFRAGLELSVMGQGLALLSIIRRYIPVPFPVGLAHWAASLLQSLGSDRGGMVVSVIGQRSGQDETRTVTRIWRLLAEQGDGPFVPAIPARAVVANGGAAPGARAAIDEVALADIVAAMDDLHLTTVEEEHTSLPLFAEVLGDQFATLGPAVRESHEVHAVSHLAGQGRVTRGPGLWPALIALAFRFPPAGHDLPVVVTKTRHGKSEIWQRRFGHSQFKSTLTATPQGMSERFGPFTFGLSLAARDGALEFPVRSGRIGPLRLPDWALPISETREFQDETGAFHFDVVLRAPITRQFIIRYEGQLSPI